MTELTMHSATPDDEVFVRRVLPALLLFFSLISIAFVYVTFRHVFFPSGDGILDATGMFIGRDFVNFWTGAHIFSTGNTELLFDIHGYNERIVSLFGQKAGDYVWSYPPHFGLLLQPLHWLPYPVALLIFELLSFGVFAWVVLSAVPARYHLTVLLLLICSPVMLPVLYVGQNGFLSAACMIGAFHWQKRRPLLAALFLAVLTFKPQLGLGISIVLLAMGAWRTLFMAAFVLLIWIGGAVVLYGFPVFEDYVLLTLPYHAMLFRLYADKLGLVSVYGSLFLIDMDTTTAIAIHAVVAIISGAVLFWAVRRSLSPSWQLWLGATGTFLLTPYAQAHDMAMLTGALIVLLFNEVRLRQQMQAHIGLLLSVIALWVLPSFHAYFAFNHWLLTTPLLAVAFVYGVHAAACKER